MGSEQAALVRSLGRNERGRAMAVEVFVHVYDVTSTGSEKTNHAIVQINKFFRDGMKLGGIFHSAVEVYDEEEWSFGYCEEGSGVFACHQKQNPMYTYRESLSLGYTSLSRLDVNQVLLELSREWPGYSYDLLSRNCNHFCNELCERLGVQKLPGWINRFANAGDVAVEVAETAVKTFNQAKTEILSVSRVAYQFMFGNASTTTSPAGLATTELKQPISSGTDAASTPDPVVSVSTEAAASGSGEVSGWHLPLFKNGRSSNSLDSGTPVVSADGNAIASLLKLPILKSMITQNRLGTSEDNDLVENASDSLRSTL